MKVALDLEEVLADTISEACNSTDKLDASSFESWDLSDEEWQVYSGVSDSLWRHDPISIPPIEDDVAEYVATIYEEVDRLDIVTARMHVDKNVEMWLQYHDIPHDDLLLTRTPKYEYEYDLYIDDNPEMFGECRLLLRDHPHNQHLDTESSESCDRIHSLKDAMEFVR